MRGEGLLGDYHAILHLSIFVFRQHVPRHQLTGIGVRPLGDDSVRLLRRDSRQALQIGFRRLVQVHGLFPAQPLFDPFRNSLCIPLEGGSGLGGFLLQLVGTLVGSASRTSCEGQTECHQAGVKRERHATLMRLVCPRLALFVLGILFASPVSLGVRVRPVRSEQR